jgi:transposase
MRAVVNAILYIASTGCQWRQLPKHFSPYSTVQGYFYTWSRNGTLLAQPRSRYGVARGGWPRGESDGRVIDSQSVKTTESGGGLYDLRE